MGLHCTGASARGVWVCGHARRTGCSGLASQPPPALACQRPLSPPAKGLPLQVPWCQGKCHRGMGPMPPTCLAHCARFVGMTPCGWNRMGVEAEGGHTPGLLEGLAEERFLIGPGTRPAIIRPIHVQLSAWWMRGREAGGT